MPALVITGNMGGGKTEVMRLLSERLNTITFLADNENRRLLDKDPEVRKLISSSLGPSCYLDGGVADRSRIFEIISADPLSRKTLEEILHPRLELLWKPLAEKYRRPNHDFFIAEIPLLFEEGLEGCFDLTLLVCCSEQTRKKRLQSSRSLTSTQINSWMGMQRPQEEKIKRADFMIWNDGPIETLASQIDIIAKGLFN